MPPASPSQSPHCPSSRPSGPTLSRRAWLQQGGTVLLAVQVRPAQAVSETPSLEAMVRTWAAGRPVTTGRVTLEVPELVENGNAVPLSVRVASPMSATDRVVEVVVYNERNPQREVLRCEFGPASPRAEAATRIRLATSQRLVALARMADGSQWQAAVDVVVTLAACVEA